MGRDNRDGGHHYFLDVLRAVACYLVVFHHCLGYSSASLGSFYIEYCKPFFPTLTLYLLLSGFVHCEAIGRKAQPYGRYVWDKFNRIMVPYFFISLVTLLLRLVAERSQLMSLGEINYTPFQWDQAGLRLFFSGVEGHYYFLEVLFLYLLVFPLLLRGLKKPGSALVFFVVVMAADPVLAKVCLRLRGPIWSPSDLVAAVLSSFKFFLFGFVLNRFLPVIKPFLSKCGVVFGTFCIVCFGYLHWEIRPPTNTGSFWNSWGTSPSPLCSLIGQFLWWEKFPASPSASIFSINRTSSK